MAAVSVAMVCFALGAHRGAPWALASGGCLIASAVIVGRSMRRVPAPLILLGFGGSTRWVLPLTLLGVGLAVGAGLAHRGQSGVLPAGASGMHPFVLLAALIGVTEELVYRGWMLGRLTALGWPLAIVVSALAHAAYKTALFVWPPGTVSLTYDLGSILLWTLVGGLALGTLRAVSRSLLPALVAHAAFDIVVYSAFVAPPWWVWG